VAANIEPRAYEPPPERNLSFSSSFCQQCYVQQLLTGPFELYRDTKRQEVLLDVETMLLLNLETRHEEVCKGTLLEEWQSSLHLVPPAASRMLIA
jgi:hypothetical protein